MPITKNTPTEGIVIYSLNDPSSGEVRYVGATTNPNRRLKEHMCDDEISYKSNWIKKLASEGLVPKLEILQRSISGNWQDAERYWIRAIRESGAKLTNMNDGGLGSINPSQETRLKLAIAGTKRPMEMRAKVGIAVAAALKGRKQAQWHVAKVKAAMLRPEVQEKLRIANLLKIGRKHTKEAKAKIGAASKCRIFSEECRRKISLSKIGRPRTEETKNKLSFAQTGKKASLETRLKMSLAAKRRFFILSTPSPEREAAKP